MPTATALALVERRLAEVTASLNAATGGAALCRIDGTGGTAKSLEGRMAALLSARRTLRRSADAPAALDPLLDRWRSDLRSRTERGASAAWVEYLQGGVAELEHLLEADDPAPGRVTSGQPSPTEPAGGQDG